MGHAGGEAAKAVEKKEMEEEVEAAEGRMEGSDVACKTNGVGVHGSCLSTSKTLCL